MDKTPSQISKKGMLAALTGTVLVAFCCFTPVLVVLLGAVGLSAFTPYLDVVLFTGPGRHDCTDHCILSAMAQVSSKKLITSGLSAC